MTLAVPSAELSVEMWETELLAGLWADLLAVMQEMTLAVLSAELLVEM